MFVEGWIFIIISLTGVRGRLVSLVPKSIMLATAGAAGCGGTHQQPSTTTINNSSQHAADATS